MAIRTKQRKNGPVYFVETKGHWERVGGDKREAERLDARRKKEVKAGTYQPNVTNAATVKTYLKAWLDARTNRSADQDRVMVEKHILARAWFAAVRLDDLTNQMSQRLIDEIKKGPPALKPKYVANIFGAYRTAMRAALRKGAISREVCLLEPGTISKKSKERVPYSLAEARDLVAAAAGDRLVWLALALYTGMRCGEVCGRRWRDWDQESKPLGALTIATQYNDQPLKGDDDSDDRPRRAPVHHDLAAILTWWWDEGFELTYLRKPTQDDFIVERLDQPGENLTRSMTYKALERDCKTAKVKRRGQHATRHTFLTQARRASPGAKELAEKITHNAEGEMVDNYTHWEWEPLCNVVIAFPSLLPNSETAPGSAPPANDPAPKPLSAIASSALCFAGLPRNTLKPAVRVLESEPKSPRVREAVSVAVSDSETAVEADVTALALALAAESVIWRASFRLPGAGRRKARDAG